MLESIRELWDSTDEKKWRDALASCWDHPSVRMNFEVSQFIENLDPEGVRIFWQ